MRVLVDMNLTPRWASTLEAAGHDVIHWSRVGQGMASDVEIMEWARSQGHLVFTHDLDFGALLALTGDGGPS